MTEKEYEVPSEHFEVEFADLDQLDEGALPPRPPFTARHRTVSLVVTTLIFVVVISVLLFNTADVRSLIGRAFFRPTATPGAVRHDLTFYLRENPSWGTFVIDGKPLAHVPIIGNEQPLTLAPGLHHITWNVEPFQSQNCTFTVTDGFLASHRCTDSAFTVTTDKFNNEPLIVSFFASLTDLPQDQRASLLQQVQATLSTYGGSETIRPGELYAISRAQSLTNRSLCHLISEIVDCFARASEPLRATVSIQLLGTKATLDDPCVVSPQCGFSAQDCQLFCDDPWLDHSKTIEGWEVSGVVRLLWTYTTLSGQVVAQNQPGTALSVSSGYQLASFHLSFTKTGWFIVPFVDTNPGGDQNDPLCQQAEQDTLMLISSFQNTDSSEFAVRSFSNQDHLAAGCLVTIQIVPSFNATPTNASALPTAYCLERFGVVLAANNVAHRLWPGMPLADAYEQDLARRLALT